MPSRRDRRRLPAAPPHRRESCRTAPARFPRRLQRFMRAVESYHENGGERRQFDRHPHQPDVVGDQRQIHPEHHELEHRVVETEIHRREPSCFELVSDVAGAENAGGERHEGVEHDENDVEIVDLKKAGGGGPLDQQQQRRSEGQQARQHVPPRCPPVPRQQGEHAAGGEGNQQDQSDRADGNRAHRRSPRKLSSASSSTLSNRSRMRNRKMTITMKAISTEKATLISTTSGMPLAPVAARTSPFSSDMKPITWPTALRRETIIRSPSRTMESAKARSSRARGSAAAVTRNMTTVESATSAMPASMVIPMPTTVSISR